MYYTVQWKQDAVSVLDQRLLPQKEVYYDYKSHIEVARSITDMVVRGAPLIGVVAAMGIALAAKEGADHGRDEFMKYMDEVCERFAATRPTAVNLFWAINRMQNVYRNCGDRNQAVQQLEAEALRIQQDDITANRALGHHGAQFIEDGDVVMTHCNAGALATAGYGTALGVVRAAIEQGKNIQVVCCETRPYLQGARLTAWELLCDNIHTTLICDNMAGAMMRAGKIQKIVVGADRIALNGDTANKIGTYSHSVLAAAHRIPFLVAAPVSTIDSNISDGSQIPIEERSADEVAYIRDVQIAPEGVHVWNPAFDVTPATNIRAIITERGVVEHPDSERMRQHLGI